MTAPAWAPTLAQVGSLLAARTVDPTGAEQGTFTDDTRPTGDQADVAIEDACNDVLGEVGEIPTALEAQAGTVAKWGAAAQIELSYYPNSVGDDPDLYLNLKKQYDERLARLVKSATDYNSEGSDSINTASLPEAGFPGLVGTTLTEEF